MDAAIKLHRRNKTPRQGGHFRGRQLVPWSGLSRRAPFEHLAACFEEARRRAGSAIRHLF